MKRCDRLTLASWITSLRALMAPLIYWQLVGRTPQGIAWAVGLLFLAGLSDVVDGWVARSRNEISEVGKAFDPFADKMVIFFTLLALAQGWGLSYWLVVIYAVKELVQVLAGVFLIRKYGRLISANNWGKAGTFGFFVGFGLFLLQRLVGTLVLGVAVALSVYALVTYYQAFRKLKKEE
jgi:cardiolipin synthase (CMP-forming)